MPHPRAKHSLTTTLAQAKRAADLCVDLKATDVSLLDLTHISDATDYFVIASGSSDTHVRAIAEHVLEELRKQGVRAAATGTLGPT